MAPEKVHGNSNHVYFSAHFPVLRIWIRDPVLFWSLDPGSEMEKIQIQDPGSEMNIRDLIFVNLLLIFGVKNT
jgi:hypothetical protein